MKKLLICAICAAILLGYTSTVNAKSSVTRISNTIRTWARNACDVDNSGKLDIADVTWFIDYCYLTEKWGKRCDANRNWEFNITDIVYFNDVCINELLTQPNGKNKVRTFKTNTTSKNRRR
jgi:hypothetical protein